MGERIATIPRRAYAYGVCPRLFCVIAIGVFAAASGGCERTKECTLIGCADQFVATVQRADGSFPSGMHRVDVLVDGVSLSCTFAFPSTTASGGGWVYGPCPSGLNVTVEPAAAC